MPVIIRLTTRVAMAKSLVWRLNSAHQRRMLCHHPDAGGSVPLAAEELLAIPQARVG